MTAFHVPIDGVSIRLVHLAKAFHEFERLFHRNDGLFRRSWRLRAVKDDSAVVSIVNCSGRFSRFFGEGDDDA